MNLLIGILQYNKYQVTSKCIDCIVKNTNSIKYKIYLLDNNSQDGSFDNIKSICDYNDHVILERSSENKGVIGGRNAIFDYFLANNEYTHILFIDNDQFVKEKWVDGYVELFKKTPKSLCGIEAWILSSSFTPLRKCCLRDSGFSYVGCGGMMISREVCESLGKFDENFSPAYFEDPDYCLRAFENQIPVLWNKTSQIDHLPHQTLGQKSLNAGLSFRKSLNAFRQKWKGKFSGGIIFREYV